MLFEKRRVNTRIFRCLGDCWCSCELRCCGESIGCCSGSSSSGGGSSSSCGGRYVSGLGGRGSPRSVERNLHEVDKIGFMSVVGRWENRRMWRKRGTLLERMSDKMGKRLRKGRRRLMANQSFIASSFLAINRSRRTLEFFFCRSLTP